ncbi:hypothetical protein BLA28_25760 [Eisenbergiella tayi]|nr:hypothetical protein BLA28_25760 [Eisenbergiella tayi]
MNSPDNTCNWKLLNATTLKLLAVVLMFLDHIHQMFVSVGAPIWLTMAGRLVFPIFLFAASESFHYTHNKKKYLQRLLFASWGMTVFTFVLQKVLPNDNVVLMNNAFSTFFVAGLYMLFWDKLVEGIRDRKPMQAVKAILFCFIPVLCALPLLFVAALSYNENIPFAVIRMLVTLSLLIPNILAVEGGAALVVLGLAFYIFRKHRVIQILVLLIFSAAVYVVDRDFQWMMCFAAIPIALYNGERGRGMKNFFYIFYPLHIGVLYIISTLFCS